MAPLIFYTVRDLEKVLDKILKQLECDEWVFVSHQHPQFQSKWNSKELSRKIWKTQNDTDRASTDKL